MPKPLNNRNLIIFLWKKNFLLVLNKKNNIVVKQDDFFNQEMLIVHNMNDVQQTAVHRRLLAQGGVDLSQRWNA